MASAAVGRPRWTGPDFTPKPTLSLAGVISSHGRLSERSSEHVGQRVAQRLVVHLLRAADAAASAAALAAGSLAQVFDADGDIGHLDTAPQALKNSTQFTISSADLLASKWRRRRDCSSTE